MRGLFGCLAVLLGAVSIALAARYGYKGADTLVDGVISAVAFGAIALCAFLFDAAAVAFLERWFRLRNARARPGHLYLAYEGDISILGGQSCATFLSCRHRRGNAGRAARA